MKKSSSCLDQTVMIRNLILQKKMSKNFKIAFMTKWSLSLILRLNAKKDSLNKRKRSKKWYNLAGVSNF